MNGDAGEILVVDPVELKFLFELRKQVSCSLHLTNKTEDFVAFKIKTTCPRKYSVRPNLGLVLPRSTMDVVVTMQAQRETPPDLQCKDKFLVQSVITSSTTKEITQEMFSKESGNKMEEVKLRVTYVPPPRPPSPVPEESDEGTSPKSSGSNNGNVMTRAFTSDSKELIEPEEKSSDAMAFITKLTEEKNSMIQQNSKLRQEQELIQRDINKNRGRFSLIFVLLFALLGIILGYFLKK